MILYPLESTPLDNLAKSSFQDCKLLILVWAFSLLSLYVVVTSSAALRILSLCFLIAKTNNPRAAITPPTTAVADKAVAAAASSEAPKISVATEVIKEDSATAVKPVLKPLTNPPRPLNKLPADTNAVPNTCKAGLAEEVNKDPKVCNPIPAEEIPDPTFAAASKNFPPLVFFKGDSLSASSLKALLLAAERCSSVIEFHISSTRCCICWGVVISLSFPPSNIASWIFILAWAVVLSTIPSTQSIVAFDTLGDDSKAVFIATGSDTLLKYCSQAKVPTLASFL